MDKYDFLNSIYKKISKHNYSPINNIMACYVALGKNTNYMSEYFYGDDYTQYNIYYNDNFIFENGKNIAICTSICKQLEYLLNKFNISSKIEIDTRDAFALQDGVPHVYTIVNLPEYSFKLDLTKDLYRIILGNRLRHFGSNSVNTENPYKTFSQSELYNIHKEIGYLNPKGKYSNEHWVHMHNVLNNYKDIDPKEKLEFILREPMRFPAFLNLGPVERAAFYTSLFKNMPEQTWTDNVMKTPIKNRNLKNNNSYNLIYSIKDKNDQLHNYIQTSENLHHFSTKELSIYLKENRIFSLSPLPFTEKTKTQEIER